MGLARAGVHLLLLEAARLPYSGSVVTLGRQHVYITGDELRVMARDLGVTLREIPDELHREASLAACGYLSDDCLLRMIGFDRVVRIDYSDYESPDLLIDLNAAETPNELQQAFDLVLDSGTIEHVFDVAAAVRHCARMVRSGGRVIHLTPASNCVEHGFHSLSPTFFADFYSACQWQINRVYLCQMPLDLPRGQWTVYDYWNSSRFIPLGQLDQRIWFTFCVATKGSASVLAVPQQWVYLNTWKDSAGSVSTPEASIGLTSDPSRAARLLRRLEGSPWLVRGAEALIRTWRKTVNAYRVWAKHLPYPRVGRF